MMRAAQLAHEVAYHPMCSNRQMQKQFVMLCDLCINISHHVICRKTGCGDLKSSLGPWVKRQMQQRQVQDGSTDILQTSD
jgi:hypothetical protein